MFEIVTTSMGVKSIRNTVVNEIMHNPVGPWAEANQLYVEQSHLHARLAKSGSELVVFDVGLGAAANALAALHCAQSLSERRELVLVSFEQDLSLARFALQHAHEFDHFAGFESALEQLLSSGEWRGPGVRWLLREGDFTHLIETEIMRPHLIFYDPYSPEVNREMWTLSNFEKIRARSRAPVDGGTVLYTYSRATPVRAALLAAGFFVGQGQATGLKDETTQAATVLSELSSPLGFKWFERWQRSHTPFPLDLPEAEREGVSKRIREHLQFLKS